MDADDNEASTTRETTMRAVWAVAIAGSILGASCGVASTSPSSVVPSAVDGSTQPSGSWVEVGGVQVRADNPHAALARGGRALVLETGSSCPIGAVPPSYVYEPTTDTLAIAPPPAPLADGFAMTSMADGRVLVAGGLDKTLGPGSQTSVWDPSAGTWAEGPHLRFSRDGAAMAALPDGRLLLTGGSTMSPVPPEEMSATDATEIYDPSAGVWTTAASLPIGFDQEPMAVALTGGQVLVVPDWFSNQETPSSALYDSRIGTWTTSAAPPDFVGPTAALVSLPDGTALAIDTEGAVARFLPASGWRRGGALLTGRFAPAVAVLQDGRVLVAGGEESLPDVFPPAVPALRTVEVFDSGSGQSSQLANMPVARMGDIALALDDGSVLVVGGREVTEAEIHATPVPEDPNAGPEEDPEPEETPRCPPDSFSALRWVP